jgi:hypothetical protein
MKQFLWQDDFVSVAKFVNACLDKMFLCATGLSNDSQTSDQPDVAGRMYCDDDDHDDDERLAECTLP